MAGDNGSRDPREEFHEREHVVASRRRISAMRATPETPVTAEHIRPGRCADTTRQFVRGFGGEAFDVTSLNRPDPTWRFVDRRGHVHQWYVQYVEGEPAKPATHYTPSLQFTLPTLTQIVDVPGDDEHPAVTHYECTACRESDTPNDIAVSLAPWLQHHSTCARIVSAGDCDCGLNDALKKLREAHEDEVMLYVDAMRYEE